jgi:hypothetical protein
MCGNRSGARRRHGVRALRQGRLIRIRIAQDMYTIQRPTLLPRCLTCVMPTAGALPEGARQRRRSDNSYLRQDRTGSS